MTVLHPTIEVRYNVDHSCGHDRQREDALNTNNMNSGYGGAVPAMHETKIKEGCLGKFPTKLKIGDVQSMVFTKDDEGPFYMPKEEREALRTSDLTSKKFKNKTRNELTPALRAKGYDNDFLKKKTMNELRKICRKLEVNWRVLVDSEVKTKEKDKTVKELRRDIAEKCSSSILTANMRLLELQNIARVNSIDIKKTITDGVTSSWVGKPKGMLQVAYERGLLDLENFMCRRFRYQGYCR